MSFWMDLDPTFNSDRSENLPGKSSNFVKSSNLSRDSSLRQIFEDINKIHFYKYSNVQSLILFNFQILGRIQDPIPCFFFRIRKNKVIKQNLHSATCANKNLLPPSWTTSSSINHWYLIIFEQSLTNYRLTWLGWWRSCLPALSLLFCTGWHPRGSPGIISASNQSTNTRTKLIWDPDGKK